MTRVQLLKEFGLLLFEKRIKNKQVSIYQIYDFYVEVICNINTGSIEKAEPILFSGILWYYFNDLG